VVIESACEYVRKRIYILYNNIRNHYNHNARIINSRRARVSRRAGSVFPQLRTPLPRELNLALDIMIHNSGDIYILRIIVRQTYIILLLLYTYIIILLDPITFKRTVQRPFGSHKQSFSGRHFVREKKDAALNHYRWTKYYYQLIIIIMIDDEIILYDVYTGVRDMSLLTR